MSKNEKNVNKKSFEKKWQNKNTEGDKGEKRLNRTQIADLEIEELEQRVREETPPCGFYYLNNDEEKNILINMKTDSEVEEKWRKKKEQFREMPLTKKTINGCL